jgi:ribosome-binding protein aMBF1 (putative translation factor)
MSGETAETGGHPSYEGHCQQPRGQRKYREGYSEAKRDFRIRLAVRERRIELGLSQIDLAARARMTQSALSRLEVGGVIPTIPLLARISAALDADLIVQIPPHTGGGLAAGLA